MESKGNDGDGGGDGMMIAAVRAYVDKMLEIPEMKVVLLDTETVRVLQLGANPYGTQSAQAP